MSNEISFAQLSLNFNSSRMFSHLMLLPLLCCMTLLNYCGPEYAAFAVISLLAPYKCFHTTLQALLVGELGRSPVSPSLRPVVHWLGPGLAPRSGSPTETPLSVPWPSTADHSSSVPLFLVELKKITCVLYSI